MNHQNATGNVIAKRPSGRRPQGESGKARRPRRKPKVLNAEGSQELELLGAYQRQMCELEWSVSASRQKAQKLTAQLLEWQEEQAHFRDHFEYAPLGYLVHDRSGDVSEINRAAASLLGLNQESRSRVSLAQFLIPAEVRSWLQHMARCAAKLYASSEFTICSRSGRQIPVQAISSAIQRPFARPSLSFRTVLIDVSQRRAAEAALSETQKEYQRLIDTVEGIVWQADARTLDINFVSGYADRLLGYRREEWTRSGFWQGRIYVEDRERVANELVRALAKREGLTLEYRVVTADRRIVWLHDNVTTIERNGQLGLLGVAVDITERRKMEQELRQAHDLLEQRVIERTAQLREKVAELEAFSYTLSHDMRSPIRAVQGYAELLERMGGETLEPEGVDFIHRIMRAAERLDLLVRDVLNYSRVASAPVELKSIPLEPVLDSIVHEYPALSPPNAEVEVQQPLPAVYGHEAFVGQALSNLLTNAVKFVPRGKRPHVRVWSESARPTDTDLLRKNEPSRWVRIWVEDNGVGISARDQQRIFRIFERVYPANKYEGTGIGLAIVQKAVERMGGRVGVQSVPGQGSKFWIELRQPAG